MKNSNLNAAKRAKNDEFYTQTSDIEQELKNYRQHFKGKVVYCNCDDPEGSNFFKYFWLCFEVLGLKKLTGTGYKKGAGSVLAYEQTSKGKRVFTLQGDGDFRSPESIALLQEADIVVTNPPFSLFREYIAQLVEYKKKFLVVGSLNAVTYKEIFPLIASGKLWLGTQRPKEFNTPGGGVATPVGALWYTNMSHKRRNETLILADPKSRKAYQTYDSYDAINVDKVVDIPEGYKGAMGVPITFLEKHNPDQFEILGLANDVRWIGYPCLTLIDGRPVYNRVIIRSK